MARYLWLLFLVTLYVAAAAAMGSSKRPDSVVVSYPLLSTVVKTYNANHAFEARDYELYINASGILPSTAGSARLRSSSVHDPISTDSLVSGPALAFIVVLGLGACMF